VRREAVEVLPRVFTCFMRRALRDHGRRESAAFHALTKLWVFGLR
jgi:hypothetical protein